MLEIGKLLNLTLNMYMFKSSLLLILGLVLLVSCEENRKVYILRPENDTIAIIKFTDAPKFNSFVSSIECGYRIDPAGNVTIDLDSGDFIDITLGGKIHE